MSLQCVLLVEELGEDTDPAVLDRCGAFFLDNGEYDKAVQLYLTGNHYDKVRKDSCTLYRAFARTNICSTLKPLPE